jgi:hypothetical protein
MISTDSEQRIRARVLKDIYFLEVWGPLFSPFITGFVSAGDLVGNCAFQAVNIFAFLFPQAMSGAKANVTVCNMFWIRPM